MDLEPAPVLALRQRVVPVRTPAASAVERGHEPSPGDAVPVEDADVVSVTGPPYPGRHHRGPIVGEPLADRPSLFALAEPPNLVVLERVAVLVQDHVGVLGVVDATAAVL